MSLKVRSRATPRCPREVYRRERQGGYYRCTGVLAPCSYLARSTKLRKSSSPRANARQGEETVYLIGDRGDLVGRQGRHRCTGGPTAVVDRGSVKVEATITVVTQVNKTLKWFGG